MGGEVGVNSEAGIGSRFWFTARLAAAASAAGPAPEGLLWGADPPPGGPLLPGLLPAGRPLRGLPAGARPRVSADQAEQQLRHQHAGARLLLAEDNLVNQEVAGALLRVAGLQVDVAGTGRQAVDMARDGAYALVLMDVQMPEMDGLDATRALRAIPACRQLPILAMTANAFGDDREACLAAGMNDHLPKPVDPAALYAALLRWLPVGRRAPAPADAAPAAAGADDPLAWLTGVDALNAPLGLQLCGQQPELYRLLLGRFVQLYHDGLPRVDGADLADAAGLRKGLHSLRGAAASIGATSLQRLAGDLEQRCNTGDLVLASGEDLRRAAAPLRQALQALIEQLRPRLGDEA